MKDFTPDIPGINGGLPTRQVRPPFRQKVMESHVATVAQSNHVCRPFTAKPLIGDMVKGAGSALGTSSTKATRKSGFERPPPLGPKIGVVTIGPKDLKGYFPVGCSLWYFHGQPIKQAVQPSSRDGLKEPFGPCFVFGC